MPYKDPAAAADYKKRWRKDNPQRHYESTHAAYKETAFAPRGWTDYTQAEDDAILAHEIPDRELAAKMERSITAIQIRRSRLKKWKEEDNGSTRQQDQGH